MRSAGLGADTAGSAADRSARQDGRQDGEQAKNELLAEKQPMLNSPRRKMSAALAGSLPATPPRPSRVVLLDRRRLDRGVSPNSPHP